MKKVVGTIISILLIIAAMLIDCSSVMPQLTFQIIMFIVAFMIMLVTDAVPIILLALGTFGLLPVLGITKNLNEAMIGFSNQVFLFVLASFGLAEIISRVPVCKRILKKVMGLAGNSISRMILAIMICTAATSAFISDVPTCVVYMAFAQEMLNMCQNEEDRKRNGRATMMGVSFASMIGGMITPVGSTVNILAMNALESITGQSVGFLQWVAYGLPFAIVMLPLCWYILIKLYKPVEIDKQNLEKFIESIDVPKKFTNKEKKVVFILVVMIALWLLSSFVSGINVMLVMLLGVCIMCIPKLEIISIKEVMDAVNWNVLFLTAAIISLGTLLINSGFSDVVMNYMPEMNVAAPIFVFVMAVIIFLLLLIVPIAPSLTAIFVPVVIPIAQKVGINPQLVVVLCSICIACGYILPMDAVYLLTYS